MGKNLLSAHLFPQHSADKLQGHPAAILNQINQVFSSVLHIILTWMQKGQDLCLSPPCPSHSRASELLAQKLSLTTVQTQQEHPSTHSDPERKGQSSRGWALLSGGEVGALCRQDSTCEIANLIQNQCPGREWEGRSSSDDMFLKFNLTERVLQDFLRCITKMSSSLPTSESKLLTTHIWSPQKGQVTRQRLAVEVTADLCTLGLCYSKY